MTEAEVEAPEVPNVPLPERPGRRLREARDARGWTLEQVATELKLQVRLVSALEADDDDQLPPPAFVAGYLRSYARLVDLPEVELIRAYELNVKSEQPPIISRARDTQVSSRDLPVRLVTWLILIGLGVLLVSWWLSQRPEEHPVAEVQAPTESAVAMIPPVPVDPVPVETPPASEVSRPAMQESRPAPDEAPVPTVSPAEATPPPEAATPEAAAEPVAATPPPTASGPQSMLRLEFEADSWTEVTDAGGRRLVYDLVPADRVLTLYGTPPFQVFLGYAPGVKVFHQGVAIDHRPFQRRDVARFRVTLPGEE